MARRSIWTGQSESESLEPPQGVPPLISIIDQIRVTQPEKRSRAWEKRRHAYTFRGIPNDLRDQIVQLAQSLSVSADDIARAFFEYGTQSYERGDLRFECHPKSIRMTLFPLSTGALKRLGWLEEWNPVPIELPKSTKHKSKKGEKKDWEYRVSYRIPDALYNIIRSIANQRDIAVGELAVFLLKHGIEAVRSGRLRLKPYPVT